MAFTHLHVHTEYSLLDGAARITDIVAGAKELGMNSLAITDHGVMFGVIDFYKECKKQGIKPILGCEVYTAARTMLDKEVEKDKYQGHLVLLAQNQEGYINLMKIVSEGFVKGFYYKPRIDKDVLRRYSKGIIALSGCLAGNVQRHLMNKDYQSAKKEAIELNEIFGQDNFFLELQDQGLIEEAEINPMLVRLSEELEIPMAATNDVHYVKKEDAVPHDVLLAIQTGATLETPNRMKFPNDEFYLKSEDEMRKIFAFAPSSIDNTQKIADRCNVEIEFGKYHLPEFLPPEGKENVSYLRELCFEGLKDRYGKDGENCPENASYNELIERLEYELDVIEKMGYIDYFLIVRDFIKYAKEKGIMVGPGRGSAAGSLVSYCLEITDIDPIKYNLIFERFLNPERVSMPDIDIDFCIERRGEVIDYVINKYGSENVSQIITFGTMKAKAAVRDVGRALNISYAETDAIAKAIPFDMNITINKALEMSPELKLKYENDRNTSLVLDMARAVEGMPRHASTHAAGVVISKEPLSNYVPLYYSDKGVSTQFPMNTIEKLGLLKMDFLGLRNLTVIRGAIELIEQNHNVKVDLSKIDYDEKVVYDMISKGNTAGIFQLESSGMTQFMKGLKPTCFEDIVAGISLYRPGPMDSIPKYIRNKKNPSMINYATPELADILDVTYGCLVYQEQVMQIVRDLGGYSFGHSDIVRRAMSKKDAAVMIQEKEFFIYGKKDANGKEEIKGCVNNGISVKAAEAIFEDMKTFAEYAFNKSHAAAYAVIAYETAYLKAHYPLEFMAALLTSVIGDAKQIGKYIRNCKEMKIEILPPSVLYSYKKFTVENGKIRFGMHGVKNVGGNAIDAIVKARKEFGMPKDIFQFIQGVKIGEINKKAIESLIKAGALDELNENRAAHLGIFESLMESAQSNAKRNVEGQMSLLAFAGGDTITQAFVNELPNVKNFDKLGLLTMENEMLGVYLTGHPLDDHMEDISQYSKAEIGALTVDGDEEPLFKDDETITIGGMINTKKTLVTKKNQLMAFTEIEDVSGSIEVIVFPRIYEKFAENIEPNKVVIVTGKIKYKEDEDPKILADSILSIDKVKVQHSNVEEEVVKVRIPQKLEEKDALEVIKKILLDHMGNTPVLIYLQEGQIIKTQKGQGINPSEKARMALAEVVGDINVKI